MTVVLVCGGRNYQGADKVYSVLDDLRPRPSLIVHGGAAGADAYAGAWARYRGVPQREFIANWSKLGKAAGPIRNQQMLNEAKPNFVVAFPGRRGTFDMVSRAKAAGLNVIQIEDPAETY